MGRERKGTPRLSGAATAEFARKFGALLTAGLSPDEALGAMETDRGWGAFRQVAMRVRAELVAGHALPEAVERSGSFPREAAAAFRAGPLEGAKLLEHYCEEQLELTGRVRAAFLQPLLLLAVAILALCVVLGGVLPGFFALFDWAELPGVTRGVAWLGAFLSREWPWALFACAVLAAAGVTAFRLPVFARQTQRVLLVLPFIGSRLRIVETGRFLQGLRLYCASGFPPDEAFYRSCGAVKNRFLSARLAETAVGESLGAAVAEAGVLDGRLPALLKREGEPVLAVASLYEEEAGRAAAELCRVVEPVLCGLTAALVLFVLLAVLLPAFGL